MKESDVSGGLDNKGQRKIWKNVLLTDMGFYCPLDLSASALSNLTPISRHQARPLNASIEKFAEMVGKPFCETKVLFIPTAAQDDEGRFLAGFQKDGLHWLGILPENLTVYDIDGSLTDEEAMLFDVIFFTGGRDSYLLGRVKQTGFDKIVKKMVYSNKVYVGQSAGTVLATPNIRGCFGGIDDKESAGLGLINAYIDCHCDMKPELKHLELPLPHIMLHFNQAIAVSSNGYEIIDN